MWGSNSGFSRFLVRRFVAPDEDGDGGCQFLGTGDFTYEEEFRYFPEKEQRKTFKKCLEIYKSINL